MKGSPYPFTGESTHPVVLVGTSANFLVVSRKLGVSDVAGLIALARNKPGEFEYSSSGVGSVAHLTAEMFASTASFRPTHRYVRASTSWASRQPAVRRRSSPAR